MRHISEGVGRNGGVQKNEGEGGRARSREWERRCTIKGVGRNEGMGE